MTLCARVAGPNAVVLAATPLVNDPGHGRAPVTDWEVDCRADGGTYCVRLDAATGELLVIARETLEDIPGDGESNRARSSHGIPLWQRILSSGAPLDIKPYGLEALAALRIEKGHVAGMELDHRTTLDDLGLGRMAGKDKPFIGRALRQRPALQAPERWSLVGLELLEPEKRLRGGAILFAKDDEIKGHGRGYITSVTWSVELGKTIALALFNGGLKHVGEEIVCAFPLKNEFTRARIVSPHFIDPEGKRLHA